MSRDLFRCDLFPRELDRRVVEAFLAGTHFQHDDAELSMSPTALRLHNTVNGTTVTVAWIEPLSRTLHAAVPLGRVQTSRTILAINCALQMLGHEGRITGELYPVGVLTFEGVEARPGRALLILGPLGLEAYRAKARRERDDAG